MNLFDELTNQLESNNNCEDTLLPWDTNDKESNKYSTKKLAKYGLILLFIIVLGIIAYDFINSKNIDSINTSTNNNQENTDEIIIQIHISGEVKNPGLYKLKNNCRVWDAIQLAGGFTENADQDSINLAKILEDGEQIKIISKNELKSTENANNTNTNNTKNNSKVNINSADLTTLQKLTGVGPSTAQKIIDYRTSNGYFKTIEDIKNVSGIGEKTFEKLKEKICV